MAPSLKTQTSNVYFPSRPTLVASFCTVREVEPTDCLESLPMSRKAAVAAEAELIQPSPLRVLRNLSVNLVAAIGSVSKVLGATLLSPLEFVLAILYETLFRAMIIYASAVCYKPFTNKFRIPCWVNGRHWARWAASKACGKMESQSQS